MTDLPKISGPGNDAFEEAGLSTLEKVARTPRDDVGAIYGMGSKGIRILTDAIATAGLGPWKRRP